MKDKRDFMDKTNSFLEEMEKAGISISNQDGETAVICEDCVVVISKSGDTLSKVEVMAIHKIEKHLYERANHTVREMYRVFRYENVQIYNEKTPSQLTKREKEAFKTVGKTVYHF